MAANISKSVEWLFVFSALSNIKIYFICIDKSRSMHHIWYILLLLLALNFVYLMLFLCGGNFLCCLFAF